MYKVSDFLSWQRAESLELSPKFQRRSVWTSSAKSFLIDTIVRGLPVPLIIIRESLEANGFEPKREVVDGQQRLRTLFSFIDPSVLKDFQEDNDYFNVKKSHNHVIGGKRFRDLPSDLRHLVLNYEFGVQILPLGTDDRTVLEIFARLNSTGLKANEQELRNAKFFGELKTLMYDLAYEQLTRWRNWTIFSDHDLARMEEVELTSELTLMIVKGIQGKKQSEINRLYEEYDDAFPVGEEAKTRFQATMDAIEDSVGSRIKTTIFSRKALFYVLFCVYYNSLYGIGSPVDVKAKPRRLPKNIDKVINSASDGLRMDEALPQAISKALRGATTDQYSRIALVNFVKSALTD